MCYNGDVFSQIRVISENERNDIIVIKIAVCDDDKNFCLIFKEYLETQLKELNIQGKVEAIYTGSELIDRCEEFSLIFLDIEMPEINGLEVYDNISKFTNDGELPYIAFLTGKDEMVFEALKKRPLTFIRKSDYKEDVLYCLKKVIDTADTPFEYYLKEGRNTVVLKVKDIEYIEKDKNYLFFYANRNRYRERGTVAEIEKKLCKCCFLRLGLGCLVNPIHIQELTTHEVILQSGKHLPISRKYRAQFRSDYYSWMVGNIE